MPLADAGARAFVRSGKVRDLYAIDADRLLLVASDRISAFDVVMPTPIPDKGRVLTGLSRFWFGLTGDIVPNHLLSTDPADLPPGWADGEAIDELRGRMMIGRRAEPLPVEVIVRGYLSGTGWKDYRATGAAVWHAPARGPARERPAARADVRAVHEGRRRRPRPQHRRRGDGRAAGRRPHGARSREASRVAALALYRFGVRARRHRPA